MYILRKLAKVRWLPARYWFYARQAMRFRVRQRDPVDGTTYRFVADSLFSYQRAKEFLGKEPETINWIRTHLREDDVFLDIGANVGTFTVFVGKHLGPDGHVFACEPHLPTASQLLQNIAANGLQDRVTVLSIAASGEDSFVNFKYKRWREGASGSQLDVAGSPEMQRHVGNELKCGMRVDTMIAQGIIRAPNLVKIDTDGIEIPITAGMKNLLTGPDRPRSVLCEIQVGDFQTQCAYMESVGYRLVDTHVVGKWKEKQDKGASLDELAFNAIYEPAA
ncbi:MAG: FkbM family methyltransferase [Alphaproteobacteria bacterium]|nr:FkbM family methyltransferase [Alphaproteobacteria bacterium]MDX5368728.1 FkbM family methyltransferase [Alphaproteobacteria bacterium]MDX5463470.1 FkbM family methyltransferase [Alphaproteobacteria bacterium]